MLEPYSPGTRGSGSGGTASPLRVHPMALDPLIRQGDTAISLSFLLIIKTRDMKPIDTRKTDKTEGIP